MRMYTIDQMIYVGTKIQVVMYCRQRYTRWIDTRELEDRWLIVRGLLERQISDSRGYMYDQRGIVEIS